ncbi:MAG: glucose-1-phosphate adenylyltransferase subunit GlgD [Lachnospiraceae bacterium]|nr:glucose-1-phosphate adenylyltransferase subunit GlgD [Lachnospiraceae bacterium]
MKAMGIIFSNIHDSELAELTSIRTVASLPFGSRYRLIDFVLSDMSNSGIYNIGIITKYNYRSLMDHLGSCSEWDLNRKNEGVVMLPPFAEGNTGMYKGKLEALHTALHFLNNSEHDYVVVCDSTAICNIDFRPAIEYHMRSGCDVTVIGNMEEGNKRVKRQLLLKTNKEGIVTDLLIDASVRPDYYTGLGMFIFNRQHLLDILNETYSKGLIHLERDYMQKWFNEKAIKISVYPFDGVVLQNMDIRSYFKNNLLLLDKKVRDGIFKPEFPIYTKVHDEAPAYYVSGSEVKDSLIADGCVIRGNVEKSVLFRDVFVEEGAKLNSCVIMQSGRIGKNVDLRYVILDKDVTVRDGTVLVGTKEHPVIIQKGETV